MDKVFVFGFGRSAEQQFKRIEMVINQIEEIDHFCITSPHFVQLFHNQQLIVPFLDGLVNLVQFREQWFYQGGEHGLFICKMAI